MAIIQVDKIYIKKTNGCFYYVFKQLPDTIDNAVFQSIFVVKLLQPQRWFVAAYPLFSEIVTDKITHDSDEYMVSADASLMMNYLKNYIASGVVKDLKDLCQSINISTL